MPCRRSSPRHPQAAPSLPTCRWPTPSTAICRHCSPSTAIACRRTACTIVSFPRSSVRSCPWPSGQHAGISCVRPAYWGSIAIRCARRSRTSTSPWYVRRRSAEAGEKVTAALGVSRLGDATAAVARRLGGRAAAVSLAVLAMIAGAATYAWLAGFVPTALSTRGWITGLLVADLVIAVALVALLAVRLTQLWLDRRRGAAGSRLHMRLVLVCSLFTITPTLIVTIILSLLVINLTDFVVKPAQASYEAARRIGEPVRRAREEEILRDIGAVASSLQAIGIDAVRDKEATNNLLERLIDGRPIIEAIVIDADMGVLERAVAPNAEGLKEPIPPAQALWRAVRQNGPVEIQ